MKKITTSLILMFCLSFSPLTFAETKVEVDLEKLDSSTRNKILNHLQEEKILPQRLVSNPNEAKKWADVVSTSIKDICRNLNVEVNEFVKTPVGKLTVGLIIWKVIGSELKGIIFGIIFWTIGMLIIGSTFYRFHVPHKVKREITKDNKKETVIDYIQKYKWGSNDAKIMSTVIHVLLASMLTTVCMLVIML